MRPSFNKIRREMIADTMIVTEHVSLKNNSTITCPQYATITFPEDPPYPTINMPFNGMITVTYSSPSGPGNYTLIITNPFVNGPGYPVQIMTKQNISNTTISIIPGQISIDITATSTSGDIQVKVGN
jgi:hypothetical protein